MNHTVIKEIVYDSFGNITEDTNESFPVPFGFVGGLQDRDTELVHFGFREYDPFTGRWTAKDPIGFAGGDTNLYGYVLKDPVNLVDPWGLYGTSKCEYYKQKCKESGGKDSYYCHTAQMMCNFFPKKSGSWSNCVRKCLQDYDNKYCKPVCNGSGYDDTLCTFNAHTFCFVKCGENKNKDPLK